MFATAVHVMEASLVALTAWMLFQVVRLSRQEQAPQAPEQLIDDSPIEVNEPELDLSELFSGSHYEQKMESLKQAQIFSGNQLLETKRASRDFQNTAPEWLQEAISLYLTGAVDFIGKHNGCDNKTRKELIQAALKSNMQISKAKAEAFFVEAVCRQPGSDSDAMVKAGALAAKSWIETQVIPEHYRLNQQLENWGVIA